MTRILSILCITFLLNGCTVWRFAVYNFADIKDHKKFPSRPLQASSEPFKFHISEDPIDPTLRFTDTDPGTKLSKYLEKTKTVAFLIIRRDTILFEHYYSGYKKESVVPSFSIAKSFTSALIGCAIADGIIGSENDPIIQYLPELKDRNLDGVTIKHLLQMTSGIRFNESYINPFGDAAKFYYGRNLRKYVSKMKPEKAPGIQFSYRSGNTQLLGAILDRVLKGKTITTYLQEKIWTPIGMELNASWSIDKKKNGMEKTFCCLNSTAHDYAKFGRLYLKNGNWNGKQIVPENWVSISTKTPVSINGLSYNYKYQWWLDFGDKADYYAEGILGQFIYVSPQSDVIMVRLGKSEGGVEWDSLMKMLAKALKRP
jgi:CubicO group peptidase (beta-lactamase class C family)